MGVYQYTIKRTQKNPIFGTVGVLQFDYKWSMDYTLRTKQSTRYFRVLNEWKDAQLPVVVKWSGGFYVWNSDLPTWCDADEQLSPLHLFDAWDRLEQAGLTDDLPVWLLNAIADQGQGNIPYAPTTKSAYYKFLKARQDALDTGGGL